MSQVEILEPPVKSEGDKKEYRVIQLPNGLKALLIRRVEDSSNGSDQEILAAANLTVGVGSFDEPSHIGGLAHFLEHMLFMGSAKYPEESGYNHFISANGGTNNAMTENEFTTYFFDVAESAFPEALDRFAQQFISPLLLKDALQREREAVDSEFQMAASRDEVRIAGFFKIFINEYHPASFFDYGNLKTLKENIADDDLYDAVREFFKKYVANNIYLSVQSKRTLDELQDLVVETFSDVKSGEIVSRSSMKIDEIFRPDFYNKMYFLKPKKEKKELVLTWYIDSVDQHYKCRPLQYLKAIFRNQSEGGIANYLREKKLALRSRLTADGQSFEGNSMFALAKVEVELTDFGLENIEMVLEAVFSYLLMIKETPVVEHRRLYNEYKDKSEIDFKFHKEPDASENVVKGAIGMKYFGNVDIFRGDVVYQEFDEKVIFDIINALNQRKFNLIIVNESHEKFDQKEKNFGTEYDEIDFPEAYQRLWDERKANPDFYLEAVNPFIATDFEIFENEKESTKYPVKILDNEIFEVWHSLDKTFKMPHALIKVNIISPKHLNTVYNSLLLKLYEKILIFTLAKKIFPALSAGLSVHSSVARSGIAIEFSGYNEKIELLVDIATKGLKNVAEEVEESIFDLQRTEMKKTLGNFLLNARRLCTDYFSKILRNDFWTDYEYYQEIDKLTFDDLQKFVHKIFRHMKVQVLVQGNVTKSKAQEIVRTLERNLTCEPLDREYELKTRGYQLPLGTNVLRMKSLLLDDDNSSIRNLYQVGPATIRKTCLLSLIESILHPKAFDYLRSKKQLGYSVGVDLENKGDVYGLCVFVSSQEHKHKFTEVQQQIETFMDEITTKAIDELTDEEFETFKEARIKMLSAEDLELDYEVGRNWREIKRLDYMFDRIELSIKVTKSLTKTDLQDFFKTFTQPENMRKLIIQVIGNQTQPESPQVNIKDRELKVDFITNKLADDESVITNVEEFKKELFLYPVVKPQIE